MTISNDIKYIGVDDHDLDLFEGQYVVPRGMAYNSYVVLDAKVAVMDTVDQNFGSTWLANLDAALAGRKPDYLVVQHMEPDHSANIDRFLAKYPSAKVVASAQAFKIMEQFFGPFVAPARQVVKEGDVLDLGKHKLQFVAAPMVHWPEVIVTYDSTDKVLFSADGFGKFGANDVEDPEGWDCEARRYYFGIVGKFGKNVQAVLKKLAKYDVQVICPLHGPILKEDLDHYLGLYQTWSAYGVETPGVVIAYTSVYGHTKKAVEELAGMLADKGCPRVVVTDLARDDQAEAVEDAFRHNILVLATTTYCGGFFPSMHEFISHLEDHDYQNRTIAFVENGSWMPAATKAMKAITDKFTGIEYAENNVTIRGALNDASRAQLDALAEELAAKF